MPNKKALALPDSLLVRYYRAGESEQITKVTILPDGRIRVQLRIASKPRTDSWRDLGGGLGYVPDAD